MRPVFSSGLIGLLILLSGILSTAVLAQENPPEAVASDDPVLATFDGGSLSLLDLDAKAASRWRLVLRGDQEEAREREEKAVGGRKELVQELAVIRILAAKAQELGLALDATREAAMNREIELILAGIYFNRLAEPAVREAARRHPQVYRDYYQEHLEDFTQPALWSFRYIFVGPEKEPPSDKPGDTGQALPEKPELSPQEKADYRARADEVYRLCKAGEDFQALAKQYSAMPEEQRGELRGPTTGTLYSPEIASALQSLTTGELSPILEAQHGFLILCCESFAPEHPVPFEEALPKIKEKAPKFMPTKVYREIDQQILDEHPPTLYPERLSIDVEQEDALIAEGDLVRLYNRDVFTSTTRQRADALNLEPKELEGMAREGYAYRLKAALARQAGIDREIIPARALRLEREFAWHNQLLFHMLEHPLPDIPAYKPPWPEYRRGILAQHLFRFAEGFETAGTPANK